MITFLFSVPTLYNTVMS